MLGADLQSPSVLGIEVGATAVRAVVLSRETLEVTAAAEAGIDTEDEHVFDSNTIRPALGEVMYQLAELEPEAMMAAISIGPPQSGVGSGPALPPWLERQARNLGQNLICAGELGVAFCPQTPVDLLISLCEEAAITLARVDLAPVAAARLLSSGGADTIMVGSGRGWRARLRNDEVLEALHTDEIDIDQPMSIVRPDGRVTEIPMYHGVGVAAALDEEFELNLGQLAAAVGAAVGVINGSPANLLDGATVVGRAVPVTGEHRFAEMAGFVDGPAGTGSSPQAIAGPPPSPPGTAPTGGQDAFAGDGQGPVDPASDYELAALMGEPGTEQGESATAQHSFDIDDLAPLQPDNTESNAGVDNGQQASAGFDTTSEHGFASTGFVPGSGDERTTVDLARIPTPPVPGETDGFDESPMLIERQPGRTPHATTTGDFDRMGTVGDKQGRSFPVMLFVLLVLILAVAVFLFTR